MVIRGDLTLVVQYVFRAINCTIQLKKPTTGSVIYYIWLPVAVVHLAKLQVIRRRHLLIQMFVMWQLIQSTDVLS